LADGNIEFLGRMDHQVKLRGFRVELGEIESELMNHPVLKEAVVIVREDTPGDKQLCAYVVCDGVLVIADIKESLAKKLPTYMIPSFFVILDRIPLTPNGKVNRKALPAPGITPNKLYTTPWNKLEEKLVEIWSEVLGMERDMIGIDSDFFDSGGHSIKATMLVSRIHKALDVRLPLGEVFKGRTIRGLAGYIEKAIKEKCSGIEPVEKKEYYELFSAQKRLYFLQEMDAGNITYNLPMVLPLKQEVDLDRLESALKELIERHESLRTSFERINGEPVQRIHDEVEFAIEYFELATGVTGKMGKIHHSTFIIQNSFIRPFDLSQAPLIRSGIIRCIDGNYIWMLDMHHIAADGTSQVVLKRDFMSLYHGEELEPLRLQYKDFSCWRNHLFQGVAIKAREDYWLGLYSDIGEIPRLNFPGDHQRPKVFTFAGSQYSFELDRDDAVTFKALGTEIGGTLYMNILAALNVLFYKYTGQTDIIIGGVVAGRPHADLEHIIGMFVNTVAMRNRPEGGKSYRAFLKEVIAHSVEAFENRDVQFEELVERLGPQRDLSRNPLFDVTMVVQNFGAGEVGEGQELPVVEMEGEIRYTNKTAKFDMTFFVVERGEDIHITLEYYTGIFKEETIQRLALHFKNVIKAAVTDPLIKLKDIGVMSGEERQQVLYTFNDTAGDYPKDKTIHELFEEQVEKTPDSISLVGKGVGTRFIASVTYRELNRKSDHLAYLLRGKGVEPDSIVGTMLERSIEMIIAIFGILKAGGAYLPIDLEYPIDRIDYMLKDSSAKVLLALPAARVKEKKESIELIDISGLLSSSTSTSTLTSTLTSTCPIGSFYWPPSPGALAYTIYTSGTSGRPKAVMVEHINVVRLVKNTNYIEFRNDDRILQTGALEFDASTFEIWGSLLNGLELYLVTKEIILSAEKLEETTQKYAISTMWLTSPLFNHLVDAGIEIFGGLRNLLVGGDILSPLHINRLRNRYPRLNVINGYGPTENTTFSTTYLITKEYKGNIPIGGPIANSTVYIVDRYNSVLPVGIGIPGELVVGGDGVARGYLNNPELTGERFSGHRSYRTYISSKKIYKTGDLARWLADGNIEFLGRIDQQVKLRGFRVELGEIESELMNHPVLMRLCRV
jgi:amino acid adenylation domain-containing protein